MAPDLLSTFASGILVALAVWRLGGFVLRVAGVTLATCGLVLTAATGSPGMAIASILGGTAWLAGHWLYAVRHHYFRSPLARRIFVEVLPPVFDPTRGWACPMFPSGSER